MNINRLAVIGWILLQIIAFIPIRNWYFKQIKKYPSTTLAKIVDIVSEFQSVENVDVMYNKITYAFSIAGTEYRGQARLGGKHEAGEEVQIRYNPIQQEESRIDNLRDIVKGWVQSGFFIVAIDLGFCFLLICFGLLTFYAGVRSSIRHPTEWMRWTPIKVTLALLSLLLIGLVFIAIGIFSLMEFGFLRQNFLWTAWNG